MRNLLIVLGVMIALSIVPSRAAEEWGIDGEVKQRFQAKVVDVLCELAGDCPDNCGDGKRYLGLLKEDGTLLLAAKNFDPFAGAVVDLLPFCNETVTADGLYIANPKMPMFVVQFKRLGSDGKWSRGNHFTKEWAKTHGLQPDDAKARNWFRSDERIAGEIEKNGVFGIPGLKPEE